MQDNGLWETLLVAFQSSPDWVKVVWLLIPPCFLLALTGIILRYRLAVKYAQHHDALHGAPLYPDRRTIAGFERRSLTHEDFDLAYSLLPKDAGDV